MESIEPFDISDAVDFQTAYLSGFLADKYDVDAEQSIDRANERVRHSTEQAFASTVSGYSSVMPEGGSMNVRNGKAKYVLFPVWLLNTTWNGEKYMFAMNGQTGKFVGKLPISWGRFFAWAGGNLPLDRAKYAKTFALITAATAAVCTAIYAIANLL